MRLISSLLVVVLGVAVAGAADAPDPDALLDRLAGKWDMIGTVMNQPVRYRAQGTRVLSGGFLQLHMIDVASPPQYEASVFIGYDGKAKDYVAHWLDAFGAAGARVVGTGKQDGNRIRLEYPYADGTFRNTFTWSAAPGSWTLLIESQGKDGKWSPFASYTMTRKSP
jgi:hypothetical protein